MLAPPSGPVAKLPTGIPGFDFVALGGLPQARCTLVTGTAGSAKTLFATQFLAEGIRRGEPGVFITFEESPADICQNVISMGWDISRWVHDGQFAFVDASPQPTDEAERVGAYDLGGLLARMEHAVRRTGARRVSVDSIGAIFHRFDDESTVRRELHRMVVALKALNVTAVITSERSDEYGDIARYGVEEFVADNVIVLRNVLDEEKRRRTVEVLKFRGTNHQKGEYPFTVLADQGIVVLPLSGIELKQKSSNIRIHSGNDDLDAICGGGFFRDSVLLVSGATGTGKTLICTEFMAGGVKNGERCLLLAFEESREQLFRNATGWGKDFATMEEQGLLRVVSEYPETAVLEDHLLSIKREIEAFRPNRVAIDSLSALERVSTHKSYREFIIGLTSFIKQMEVAGLFTATTPTLMGGTSVTESHISTITDSIILLRYVELFGEMRRGLTVLKMRGSHHERQIREFTIDASGLHVGMPFRNVSGIISGRPQHLPPAELDRMEQLFQDGA